MSISIKYLFPGILAVAFSFTSLVLVAGLIYFFYTDTANFLVKDKAAFLQVVQRSIYDPQFYYRTFGAFPALKRIVILEAAKSPDVVFLRIVEPSSGKIVISGNEEENGKIAANTPFFFSQPSVRDGKWQSKSIKEISIEGVAGEALWMGVDFGSIQKMALVMAIQATLLIVSAMIISYILLFFILRKFFMKPFANIVSAIRRFGSGELKTEILPGSAALKEINELGDALEKMVQDIINSRLVLEGEKNTLEAKIVQRTQELRDLAKGLDIQVKERTKEVYEKMDELEKFNKLAVGRETKMAELKEKIAKLEEENQRLKNNYA